MSRCDVCYIISYGFSERMILHTDVIKDLRKHGFSNISVIFPAKEGKSLKNLERYFGVKVYCLDVEHSFWSKEYLSLRTYIYEDITKNPALLSKHLKARHEYKGHNPWRKVKPVLYYGIHKASMKIQLIKKIFGVYENFILRNRKLKRLLKEINPKMLVATYPINFMEAAAIRLAKDNGIVTVTHLSSWDNITCKGRFPALSDYFISWGKIMTEELKEYYKLTNDSIYETGVSLFDKSIELASSQKIETYLEEMELDPKKPYLFFGMSSPYFAPKEIDIVERLADQIKRNIYGEDMQLIVRPHPQNVQGEMKEKDWLSRLESLSGNRIAVNLPLVNESKFSWNLEEEDLDKLANIISGCSMLINTGSTLSLEGILHGKPVIVTLFDADYNMKVYNSANRIKDYFHFRKLINHQGVEVVYHYEALKSAILKYLENPSLDKEKREKAVQMQFGNVDGGASKRLSESLLDIMKKKSIT